MHTEDAHASFLFVGDLNGHHLEWLGSPTTNCHGVAAFEFAIVSSCDQPFVGPTHARGGTLDLLMTDVPDVPDLVRVTVESVPETSSRLEYCLWCNKRSALA